MLSPRPDLPGFWTFVRMELPYRRRNCSWFTEWGWHWRNQEIETTRQVRVLLPLFFTMLAFLIIGFQVLEGRRIRKANHRSIQDQSMVSSPISADREYDFLVVHKVSRSVPQYGSSWHASLRIRGHGARLIQRSRVFRHFLGVLSDYGITWEWVTRRIINPGKLLPRSPEKVGSPTNHVEDNYPPSRSSAINLSIGATGQDLCKLRWHFVVGGQIILVHTCGLMKRIYPIIYYVSFEWVFFREEPSPKSWLRRLRLQQSVQRWWGLQLWPGTWVWRSSPVQ